jgi:MFS family permease
MNLLVVMTGLLIVTYFVSSLLTPADDDDSDDDKDDKDKDNKTITITTTTTTKQQHKDFNIFRRKYLTVYLIVMLADWMQGTHMYTLYLSYNVNISALFLTGFLSGAVFAPFLGSFVDKFGRKRSCIIYCLLEIVINILEHFDDFPTLLFGRVLGGISTNLLFSAFESWMTTQHRHLGFPEKWLQKTYSHMSIGNGTMAILAGIVAQLLEDSFGHIGPFQGAVALTVLALVLIMFGWDENYGEANAGEHESSSLYSQFKEGWKATLKDSKIWRIGMTQAMSEGAMYTFVFMWVPTLLKIDPPGGVPTGCVFSSLMMAITMGGMMFPVMNRLVRKFMFINKGLLGLGDSVSSEMTASLIYALASGCMAIPALCLSNTNDSASCFQKILVAFVVVEFSVGLFNPVAGTLRSKYVPDNLQGGILNIFRLPLNAVVVAGTYATDVLPTYQVYMIVSGCFMGAAVLQATMIFGSSDEGVGVSGGGGKGKGKGTKSKKQE